MSTIVFALVFTVKDVCALFSVTCILAKKLLSVALTVHSLSFLSYLSFNALQDKSTKFTLWKEKHPCVASKFTLVPRVEFYIFEINIQHDMAHVFHLWLFCCNLNDVTISFFFNVIFNSSDSL